MSISSLYTDKSAYQFGTSTDDPQVKNDLKAIGADLSANNIAGAQKDFAALLNDATQLQTELQNTQAPASSQSTALNALSTALQSGDTTGAQTALSSLSDTMRSYHQHHHHRGGNSAGGKGAGTSPEPAQVSSDFQALSSALRSGDLASAQQAFAQLQKDEPKSASGLTAS